MLEENGIHVDRVAGTSMGAVVGAARATYIDATSVDALIYEFFVRNNPLGDYTVPTKSIIRGRRTDAGLQEAFAGPYIEALPLEFRCVSVDLLQRRTKGTTAVRWLTRSAPRCGSRCSRRWCTTVAARRRRGAGQPPVTSLSRAEGPISPSTSASAPQYGPGDRAPPGYPGWVTP